MNNTIFYSIVGGAFISQTALIYLVNNIYSYFRNSVNDNNQFIRQKTEDLTNTCNELVESAKQDCKRLEDEMSEINNLLQKNRADIEKCIEHIRKNSKSQNGYSTFSGLFSDAKDGLKTKKELTSTPIQNNC